MPLVTQPNLVELSEFLGFGPDGLEEYANEGVSPDISNLLIDPDTGSLRTRPGFRRLSTALSEAAAGSAITSNHYIKQLYSFSTDGDHYLIAVVVKDAAEANNVQLFAVDLADNSVERIDTAGVTWTQPDSMFWFMSIDGKLYGGSRTNPMFSWDGTTYDGDVSAPNTKTWTDDTGASITTATEYARDYAWQGKEFVEHNGDVYSPNKDIRYEEWETGKKYRKRDLVSRKQDGYYRSYKCTSDHTSDAAKRPDDGADWNSVWDREKLGAPTNDDGETRSTWTLIPPAAETSIAAWFSDRLFLRFDGQGDKSRLQFSAPVKPDKGQDIPNVSWNPKDWAPGNDFKGQGGGWIPFNDGKHGGVITALRPLGQYLVVFKRRAVFVLSGTDDTTWNVRRVAQGVGCVGQQAAVTVDGLIYFLSDDGLYVTDGTAVEPAPGTERITDWLRARLDLQIRQELNDGIEANLFKWNEYIGIAIPDQSNSTLPYVTLFYHPETESFWKTDLPVLDFISFRDKGIERAAFSRAYSVAGTEPKTLIYIFDKSDAGDVDDDGASATVYASTPIAWSITTWWLTFGSMREMRRIRRVWATVKGAFDYVLTGYRDYSTTTQFTASGTAALTTAGYLEGKTMPDAHALRLKLTGASAPARVYSFAVDTQPRRRRYHA